MFFHKSLAGIFMWGIIWACTGEVVLEKNVSVMEQMIEKELRSGLAKVGSEQGLALLAEISTGKMIVRVRIGDEFKDFIPGSMFKPLVIAAALDLGTTTPQTEIDCGNGLFWINGKPLRDIVPYQKLTVSDISAKSSNIGTAKIAIRMGADKLIPYLKKLNIPYPEDLHNDLVLSRFALGYSYVSIQPEQLLSAWCKLAIGDKSVFRAKSTAPAVIRMLNLGTQPGGSAWRAATNDGRAAAQVGTFRVPSSNDYIGSCIGFAPYDQPKYALLVSVKGQSAPGKSFYGNAIAPIWKNIMEKL